MAILSLIVAVTKLLLIFPPFSSASDVITHDQPLPDGRTLVSKDGIFELGFFSPGGSTHRYVGIWYKSIPQKTVVWVANREKPVKDNSDRVGPETRLNRRLTAWRNWDDPSPGDFTCGVALGPIPELVMWKGSEEFQRSGPWNGVSIGGKTTPLFQLQFVVNEDEVVYTSNLQDKSVITRVVLNQTVYFRQRYIWDEQTKSWILYSSIPKDNCDSYNPCGPNGNCIASESPRCQCLTGFKPKSPQKYDALDWTQGCVRSEPWRCRVREKDGFRKFNGLKMPDTRTSWVNASMRLSECKAKCWENCSCKAYANLYITAGGSGCILWFDDLIDLRVATVPSQDLFIRMAYSDTVLEDAEKHKKKVVVGTTVTFSLVLMMLLAFFSVHGRIESKEVHFLNQMIFP
ncbi:G-type lectin S-receptor-like serine/threonine-protein kinase At4g27290 [Neltuma alba]|uniref:G-type lectin S-receptor-like serine/threonine-protein kinase At4g27290 n=1 Tax=Neltuma alba TaxID=207710 RepID=UPI0010A40820|nr:G-type lectin S-receptor-like serine/threonine-protein kinase At4g27290 [Prosopis alba]